MAESAESTAKRCKISIREENETAVDRISQLPDYVLCHILSFLPTKLAVATSALSTRWRPLWTLVTDLDFCDNPSSSERRNDELSVMGFSQFVCRVLILLRAECISKFRLSCDHSSCDSYHVETWVLAVISRNVEQLDLTLSFPENIELPPIVFTCKTLVVLKLSGEIELDVPSTVNLPSLKVLHLKNVIYTNVEFRMLIAGCPILEYLFIDRNKGIASKFHIFAPTLKILHIDLGCSNVEVDILEIKAPFLECFTLKGHVCNGYDYFLKDSPFLEEANLDVSMSASGICGRTILVHLLDELNTVKRLLLSESTTNILGCASIHIPLFPYLIHLELTIGKCDWELLVNFLQGSFHLSVLVIENVGCYKSHWVQPTHDPFCLRKFSYRGYQGFQDELELAGYILKNADALETMTISTAGWLDSEEKLQALRKLSMFPRASRMCQLEFH